MKTAIYPGSFDPVTNGHIDLVKRASTMFDKLIVAVAAESTKHYLFTVDERVNLIKVATADVRNLEIVAFEGLLADLASQRDALAIVRGLRAVSDFEYEFQMALMNRQLTHHAETVFLMPSLRYVYLSSSIVKDVAKNGGNVQKFVPDVVEKALKKKYGISK